MYAPAAQPCLCQPIKAMTAAAAANAVAVLSEYTHKLDASVYMLAVIWHLALKRIVYPLLTSFSACAVARIALVKQEKARGVENLVLQMAQRGQITEKVGTLPVGCLTVALHHSMNSGMQCGEAVTTLPVSSFYT